MKANEKPLDILTRLNQMADFAIDEEIDLFEVLSCNIIFYYCNIKGEQKFLHFVVHIQEIKFEPHVMCEPVDKGSTFRFNQV